MSDLSLADVLAGLLALALNAYVLFGGADFGGGVWDLLAGGPRKARQRMNSYIVAVQAAVDGVGIALGWRRMVEGYLRQGLLVPAVDAAVPTVNAYYQTYSVQRPLGPAAQELHDWLARETR